ncbi:hypothetical protein FACS189491_11900 [Spirochaetia bacterium]|nr:hypothetical protein FACS189491_11900 [Spirochaetia bacterium]
MVEIRSIVIALIAASILPDMAILARDWGHGPDCTIQPVQKWLDMDTVRRKATEAGYRKLVVLDVRGSCYHAHALTYSGLEAEVYFDPTDGDVVSAEIFEN